MRLTKYLNFSTLFVFSSLFFCLILMIEFFLADGDGLIRFHNIKTIGFNTLIIESLIFSVYKLSVWRKNFALLTIAILSCVFTLLLVEWGVGIIMHFQQSKITKEFKTNKESAKYDFSKLEMVNYKEGIILDDTLGHRGKPNWNYLWIGQN